MLPTGICLDASTTTAVGTGGCNGAMRRRDDVYDSRRHFPPHPLHRRRCDGGRIPNSGDPATVDLNLPVSRGASGLTWIPCYPLRYLTDRKECLFYKDL
ncbi:unnamed protein product [Urochloa humidicola]